MRPALLPLPPTLSLTPAGASVETPVGTSTDSTIGNWADDSSGTSIDTSTDASTGASAGTSIERHVETPVGTSAISTIGNWAENSSGTPVDTSADAPIGIPFDELFGASVDASADAPINVSFDMAINITRRAFPLAVVSTTPTAVSLTPPSTPPPMLAPGRPSTVTFGETTGDASIDVRRRAPPSPVCRPPHPDLGTPGSLQGLSFKFGASPDLPRIKQRVSFNDDVTKVAPHQQEREQEQYQPSGSSSPPRCSSRPTKG